MSGQRLVRVALLDSGVNPSHPHLEGLTVQGFSLEGDQAPFTRTDGFTDRTGHGTACAAAMFRLYAHIELLAVRVLDADLSTTHLNLAEGIRVAAREGAEVINLSLGSLEQASALPLQEAISEALDAGAFCIAAAHPLGQPLWPADLPLVISAQSHRSCPLRDLYRIPGPLPRFLCHGYPRPIEGRPPTDNLYGPSMAAAHLSARVARLKEAGTPSFEELIELLEDECTGQLPTTQDAHP